MGERRLVETESGREVRMSYRQGCHDYAIGVATAFFMATTVLGFVILWRQHVPESVYVTAVPFFVLFALGGFACILIAYTRPVWLYELLEERDGDG